MFENEHEKSKAILKAEENQRKAKQQLLNAKKKDTEKGKCPIQQKDSGK